MRKPSHPLYLACLLAALPLGCAHQTPATAIATPSLAGIWHGTTTTPQGATALSTFTFTADGRETMAVQLSAAGHSVSLSTAGTYALSHAQLTQTITAVTVNGKPAPLSTGSARSETDRYTLRGDTLTVTKPGSPIPLVLTRQKP